MGHEECAERLRLTDEYSQAVTAFQVRMEALRRSPQQQSDADWVAIQAEKAQSEVAWLALERHLAEHQCLRWYGSGPVPAKTSPSDRPLEKAAASAPDIILVADDDRRFIDVNEAALDLLGLPRDEIVGHRIDEFFSETGGETIPAAWNRFISAGVQRGICELSRRGRRRKFEYRAKSSFAPGLHLSVLRELE